MGDSFSPLLGPYLRAIEIKSAIDDINWRREQRELQKEQFKNQVARERRANQMQDLQTRMSLHSMGALPSSAVEQAGEDVMSDLFGGTTPESTRVAVDTPFGSYRLPSEKDKSARMMREAQQAGVAAGIKQNAQESITDPFEDVPLPPELGGGTARVSKKNKIDAIVKIQNALEKKNPDLYFTKETNDAGDTTVIGLDKSTGEEKYRKTFSGAGKSKTTPAGQQEIPDFDAEVKTRMDSWRQGHYAQNNITPQVQEMAQGGTRWTPEEQQRAQATIRQAEDTLYRRALDSVRNAGKGAGKTAAQPATKPYKGMRIRRANVNAAAAKKKMTAQEFERRFLEGGGEVIP